MDSTDEPNRGGGFHPPSLFLHRQMKRRIQSSASGKPGYAIHMDSADEPEVPGSFDLNRHRQPPQALHLRADLKNQSDQ